MKLILAGVFSAFVWTYGVCKTPLYIGSLQELTEIPFWYEINTLIPAMANVTLERINNQSELLTDYELKIIHKDIKVGIIFYFYILAIKIWIPSLLIYTQALREINHLLGYELTDK